jgi:hypothetical protein
MRLVSALAAVAACAAALFAAAQASAAVQAGSDCPANYFYANNMVAQLSRAPGAPLPIDAPVSGVVTKWRMTAAPTTVGNYEEAVSILHPTVVPNAFEVRSESALSVVTAGVHEFPTRLPIQAGDKLGFWGNPGPLVCNGEGTQAADVMGFIAPPAKAGSFFNPTAQQSSKLISGSVTIEPDADGDGYGDETQDLCPQSAATQAGCPVVSLSLSRGAIGKTVARVRVTTDHPAPVTVTGTVKAGGKKLKLKGGSKSVAAGQVTTFKLTFPANLKTALRKLPAGKRLALKVVATAANLAGPSSVKKKTLKLKGQA